MSNVTLSNGDTLYYPGVTDGPPVSAELGAMMQSVANAMESNLMNRSVNLVINGDFRVNQRNTVSGTTWAINEYFLDRWKNTYGSPTAGIYWTGDENTGRVVSMGGRDMGQIIERRNVPAGTYTLSWTGTTPGRVYNNGTTAPAYAAGPITVTLNGTTDVRVEFNSGTVSKVKLEAGSIATPFQITDYGEELAKCQRYYYQMTSTAIYDVFGSGVAYSTTAATVTVPFPARMRAVPTLTASTPSGFQLRTAATLTPTGFSMLGTTQYAAGVVVTVSGATAGQGGYLRAGGSGSYLAFDAEL